MPAADSRTRTRFIRVGPAAIGPRRPAVPNSSRPREALGQPGGVPGGEHPPELRPGGGIGVPRDPRLHAPAQIGRDRRHHDRRGHRAQQVDQPVHRGLSGGEHLPVVERLGGEPRGEVGDQRDAEDLGPQVARGDGLEHGGHAHQVGAHGAQHPDLGGRLVAPAQQAGVDALGDARRRGRRHGPQARAVEVGEVREAGGEARRGIAPGHRAHAGQVEVVADEHGRAGAVRRHQRPGGVREEHGPAAGEHGRPHAVDDRGHGVVLVEVRAAREHEHGDPADVHRVRHPGVALHRRGGEPGQLGHGDARPRLAQGRDHVRPSGPQHEGGAMLAEALADPGRAGPRGEVGIVRHGAHYRTAGWATVRRSPYPSGESARSPPRRPRRHRMPEGSTVPMVLIHGAWLSSNSWDNFATYFGERGYEVTAPEWPRKQEGVEAQREHSEDLAGLGVNEIVNHYDAIIRGLDEPPVIMGHSFGGLFTQLLLDRGLGRAGVAMSPAQPKGILRLPLVDAEVGVAGAGPPVEAPRRGAPDPRGVHLRVRQHALARGREGRLRDLLRARDRADLLRGRLRQLPAAPRDGDRLEEPRPGARSWSWARRRTTPSRRRSRTTSSRSRAGRRRRTAYLEFEGRPHMMMAVDGWEEIATAIDDWLTKL